MKLLPYSLIATALLTSSLAQGDDAPNLEAVGILPAARQGSTISADERSPFGLPTQKRRTKVNRLQYSQEDTIRDILSTLKVTGIVDEGQRLLLGDMIVQKGHPLDDVIPGQTEQVICNDITTEYLDVEFIGRHQTSRGKKRELRIPIDMTPRVEIRLKGGQSGMSLARTKEDDERSFAFDQEKNQE